MGAFKVELEERTIAHADDLSKRWFGNTFDQLSKDQQYKVWEEAEELARSELQDRRCPCGESLRYFSGLGSLPEYFYCPKCNNKAYAEDGTVIALLV